MTGRKQIVPVDSRPRGATVYDENGKRIGITPFFYKYSKRFGQEFTFEMPEADQKSSIEKINYRCRPNWSESIIPDSLYLPFYPLGTAVGSAFLLTDFFTGGAIDCQNPLFVNFASQSRGGHKKSRKYLIIPPNYFDEKVARNVARYWVAQRFDKFRNPQDEVVSYESSSTQMLHYGIDHNNKNSFHSIPYSHLIDLAYQYNANMIVEFELKREGALIVITPKITDIFTKEVVGEELSRPYRMHKTLDAKDTIYYYLVKSISLIPNSFSLSFPPTRQAEVTQGETNSEVHKKKLSRHHEHLPNLFAIWGVSNIDHPLHFRRWDLNPQIRAAFSAHAWEFGEQVAGVDYHIGYQDVMFNIGGSLTFHTPFGALYGEAGGGPFYYRTQDNYGFHKQSASGVFKLELSYYAFMGKKFYVKVGVHHFEIPDHLIFTKYFQLKSWQDTVLTFGLFLPELKSLVRNAIPF